MTNHIAFQGALGAYSHAACQAARPDMTPLPCDNFEDVIEAVRSGGGRPLTTTTGEANQASTLAWSLFR